MASLSTLYFMSVLLASVAGIGSTFIGDRVYPIQGGGEITPPTPEEVAAEAADDDDEVVVGTNTLHSEAGEGRREYTHPTALGIWR